MKKVIMFEGNVVGSVMTNRRMTAEEICEMAGVELAVTQEDWEGMPENGKYCLDDLEIVEEKEAEKMTKYEIVSCYREISYNSRDEILQGCTLDQAEADPDIIESYMDIEAAREALKKYSSSVTSFSGSAGSYFGIVEYYIQQNEYNEDGEWIGGGDVWDFSPLPEIE